MKHKCYLTVSAASGARPFLRRAVTQTAIEAVQFSQHWTHEYCPSQFRCAKSAAQLVVALLPEPLLDGKLIAERFEYLE